MKKALDDGYVETIFGRRRPTPDLKSSNFAVREAAKRAAMNMPIQGTEADLMKLAMLKVEKVLANQSKSSNNTATSGNDVGEGKDGEATDSPLGEQILQVHDSILVECPEKNVEQVVKLLKETMESIHPLPVHLIADITTGHNWGEL